MSSEKLEEKEVKILREAVDKAEKKKQIKSANSPQIVNLADNASCTEFVRLRLIEARIHSF